MLEGKCQVCSKKFKYHPKVQRGKYCSNKCQGAERKQQQDELNKKLLLEGKLSDKNRQRIKKTMLLLGIKNECSICKIKNWLGKPLPFILDHIDGDSQNNFLSNLRLICSNCDSQTENYKAKNIGHGRKNRVS